MKRIGLAFVVCSLLLAAHSAFAANASDSPEDTFVLTDLNFAWDVADLHREYSRLTERWNLMIKEALELETGIEKILDRLDLLTYEYWAFMGPLSVLLATSEDEQLKRSIESLYLMLFDWYTLHYLNEHEIYLRLRFLELTRTIQDPPRKALLEALLQEFRSIYEIDEDLTEEENRLKKDRLITLGSNLEHSEFHFNRNHSRARENLKFKLEELKGVPEHFLGLFRRDAKDYVIEAHEYWQYSAIMRYAESARVRDKVAKTRLGLASEINPPLLKNILSYRQAIAAAHELASPNEHQFIDLLFEEEERAFEFIANLLKANSRAFREEQKLFEKEKARRMRKGQVKLQGKDWAFYREQYLKRVLQYDEDKVREYLPTEHVVAKTLELIAETFHLEIIENEDASRWQSDVRVFDVKDRRSGEFLGRLFLDLYPRKGKDSWFFNTNIVPRARNAEGQINLPQTAVICNFPKSESQSLMSFEDLETFLHELGHAFHDILTESNYASLSGTNVYEGLVETPSSFWELFAAEPNFLKRVMKHYAGGPDLSSEEIERIIEANQLGKAHQIQQRAAFALLDLELHKANADPEKMEAIERTILKKYFYELPGGRSNLPGFTHITGGYASLMWTYSLGSYAALKLRAHADTQSAQGILDPEWQDRYRRKLLVHGRQRSTRQILEDVFEEEIDPCSDVLTVVGKK